MFYNSKVQNIRFPKGPSFHLLIGSKELRFPIQMGHFCRNTQLRTHRLTRLCSISIPPFLLPLSLSLSQVLWRNWDKPHAASQISLHLGQEQDLHRRVCVFTPEGEQSNEMGQPFPAVSTSRPNCIAQIMLRPPTTQPLNLRLSYMFKTPGNPNPQNRVDI